MTPARPASPPTGLTRRETADWWLEQAIVETPLGVFRWVAATWRRDVVGGEEDAEAWDEVLSSVDADLDRPHLATDGAQ